MKILFLHNGDLELAKWLRNKGEAVFSARNKIDVAYLRKIRPEMIISFNYRYKLPLHIIKYPSRGAINLHISYLPYNRGADPNIWSFLENSPKGVTIHFMDEGIDTGDVLFQEKMDFNREKETLESTYNILQIKIKDLFKKNWARIKNSDFTAKQQKFNSGTCHFKRDRIKFEDLIRDEGWKTPVNELCFRKEKHAVAKIDAIIQARVNSTRLFAKVLKKIKGKTILSHVIERARQAKKIDDIIVATTTLSLDEKIVNEAKKARVKCFRGSEEDVLSRYYFAAKEYGSDIVVRITSDCPLIDPLIIDECIGIFISFQKLDYLSNIGTGLRDRTYPRGLDVEVFSFRALEKAFKEAKKTYEREHVTPYIYLHPEIFNLKFTRNPVDHSGLRWTVDVPDDFKLIKKIYDELYKGKHDFYFKDILNIFAEDPGLARINAGVAQKNLSFDEKR